MYKNVAKITQRISLSCSSDFPQILSYLFYFSLCLSLFLSFIYLSMHLSIIIHLSPPIIHLFFLNWLKVSCSSFFPKYFLQPCLWPQSRFPRINHNQRGSTFQYCLHSFTYTHIKYISFFLIFPPPSFWFCEN